MAVRRVLHLPLVVEESTKFLDLRALKAGELQWSHNSTSLVLGGLPQRSRAVLNVCQTRLDDKQN